MEYNTASRFFTLHLCYIIIIIICFSQRIIGTESIAPLEAEPVHVLSNISILSNFSTSSQDRSASGLEVPYQIGITSETYKDFEEEAPEVVSVGRNPLMS